MFWAMQRTARQTNLDEKALKPLVEVSAATQHSFT